MNEHKADVVFFEAGAPFVDLVFEGLKTMPKLGEEIFAERLTITAGGAFNTAAALTKLGVKTALVADIDTGFLSAFLLAQMKEAKIDTRYLNRRRSARALTVSLSYPKERAFVSFQDEPNALQFPSALMKKGACRLLLLGSVPKTKAMLTLVQKAKEAGMRIAYDFHLPWGNLADKRLVAALSLADILLPNASEAKLVTGKINIRQALKALSAFAEVAIKDGKKGAIGFRNGEIERVGALPIKVKDTTGAGDCFNAGYLASWLKGEDLRHSLGAGVVAGGLAASESGGWQGAPTAKTLYRRREEIL